MSISYPDNTLNRSLINASGLTDNSTYFDIVSGSSEKRLSLEELKKTGVQVVNVLQYGADPTGVASSAAAVIAAFDAAQTANIPVYFPPGTYDLSSWTPYLLANESLTVVCDPGVIIQSDGATDFIRCGTNASLKWTGGRITNFAFGLVPLYGSTGGNIFIVDGVEIDTCTRGICDSGTNSGEVTHFEVKNCKIHDCDIMGIVLRSIDIRYCRVVANEIYNLGGDYTGVWGIAIGVATDVVSSGNILIEGNFVHDIASTSLSASEVGGIHSYCEYTKILGNTVENVTATTGTDAEGIYGKVRWAVISNNVITNAGEGGEGFLTVKGEERAGVGGEAWGYQVLISNNQIIADRASTTANTGIYAAVPSAIIANNSIECSGSGVMYRGIAVSKEFCTVRGNVLHGLTTSTLSTIGIASLTGNTTIVDNNLNEFTNGGSGGIYGVYVQSGAALENVVASRNIIRSFTGGTGAQVGIGVAHVYTITNLTIEDNVISDCSQGINTHITGSATLSNVSICRNKIFDLDRASLIVIGIWAQYIHDGRINDNTIDDLNGDDVALDARGIYLFNQSANQMEDIECRRNQISNVTHSTAPNSRDRSTYIHAAAAMDGMVFSDNVVRDCGIGYHNSGMSSIANLVYANNRSISNTTAWSATTFADDALVYGNTQEQAPAAVNKVVEVNVSGSGSPNILLSSESSRILTNEGATALNYHTLPTAAAGLTFTFIVQDTDGMRITANTGDTIQLGTNVTASAGYIQSTVKANLVILTAINATEWIGLAYGTWTNGTWTYEVIDTP